MTKLRSLRLVFALLLTVLLGGVAVDHAEAHTGYSQAIWVSNYQTYTFGSFYISSGTTHYIQQTSPRSFRCRHLIYFNGSLVSAQWLTGDGSGGYSNTMGIYNGYSTSIKVTHKVTCGAFEGYAQVYYFHG